MFRNPRSLEWLLGACQALKECHRGWVRVRVKVGLGQTDKGQVLPLWEIFSTLRCFYPHIIFLKGFELCPILGNSFNLLVILRFVGLH